MENEEIARAGDCDGDFKFGVVEFLLERLDEISALQPGGKAPAGDAPPTWCVFLIGKRPDSFGEAAGEDRVVAVALELFHVVADGGYDRGVGGWTGDRPAIDSAAGEDGFDFGEEAFFADAEGLTLVDCGDE